MKWKNTRACKQYRHNNFSNLLKQINGEKSFSRAVVAKADRGSADVSGLKDLNKKYWVVDCGNTYYRLDEDSCLVPAASKYEASVFTYMDACRYIKDGYEGKVLSAEAADEAEVEHISTVISANDDLSRINWTEYLNEFCNIVSSMNSYRNYLTRCQTEAEQEIQDLLHLVELYDLNDVQKQESMDMLRNARERRRMAKDNLVKTEQFQSALGTNANVAKVRAAIKVIEKLDSRAYAPRKLTELFEGTPLLKNRSEEMMTGEDYTVSEAETFYEEEKPMVTERIETVYDSKKMNWMNVAKEQMEFFSNIEQHLVNLKYDIAQIDMETEEAFREMENAKCNVTQGYKMFKRLQELRKQRSLKEKELHDAEIIVQCFDCASMADAYVYCVEQIADEESDPAKMMENDGATSESIEESETAQEVLEIMDLEDDDDSNSISA